MQRMEIDGVPVLWEQGPAPLRATLTFGVGARDETFRTIGVTHLVEHLAMGALPRVHYDVNASVDLNVTAFTVCARPEQVVEFLDQVCRALGSLPVERIGKEAGVLAAEGGSHADPTVEALLHERYGARGPGLGIYLGPGYDRLGAEHVQAHVARYFVAGNAVLQLTGPPPEGLRLPLAPGPRVVHHRADPRRRAGPTWISAPIEGVGVSLLGRRDAGWTAAIAVLGERLEQTARHERGLSYEVGGDSVPIGGDETVLAVTVDAREGQEGTVATLLWDELNRLAADGPTDAELAHTLAGAREVYHDPRYIEGDLANAAEALLLGLPFREREQRLALLAQVSAADVRTRLSAALPTAQLVVPWEVTPDIPALSEGGCERTRDQPAGRVFKPPLLAKVMTRHARGLRLILMPDGVALRDPDGDVHTIRWHEVVAVERDGSELTVFSETGCQVPVDPELFAGAEAVVAAVEANVPAALRYDRSALVADD